MIRGNAQRFQDILDACAAIRAHAQRGPLDDDLVFDAIRARLIEIGEATKAIDGTLLATEPAVPWSSIAGMRDRLAHHYFAASRAVVARTVESDLVELEQAASRILVRVTGGA